MFQTPHFIHSNWLMMEMIKLCVKCNVKIKIKHDQMLCNSNLNKELIYLLMKKVTANLPHCLPKKVLWAINNTLGFLRFCFPLTTGAP